MKKYIKVIDGVSFMIRKEDHIWCGYELTESGAMFYGGLEVITKTKKEAIAQCIDYMNTKKDTQN